AGHAHAALEWAGDAGAGASVQRLAAVHPRHRRCERGADPAGVSRAGLQCDPQAGQQECRSVYCGPCPGARLRRPPGPVNVNRAVACLSSRSNPGMKVVPLNDKIVVKRLEAEEKTAGGIVLPDTAKEKPKQGKVLSLGDGKLLDNGKRASFQVKE